ncbi:MAG: MlaD family protein [Candidatus Marinimicrobia bacterium]|nr:MlaD family protein [Candidatus Neomarinimicrobiota bacterium]MCF7839396.1 MlaD family protein [Candidatus Neomarinimicrobiota bacterium]
MRREERKLELIVGAVMILIIALTIFGVMWGNKYHLFSARNYYMVRFARASGLEEGNPVTVSGVPKGIVSDFIVHADSVDVIIALDKDITIYNDAAGIIVNQELLGSKKIEVNPGHSGVELPQNGLFRGSFAGGLEDLVESVGSITAKIDAVVRNLDELTRNTNKLVTAEITPGFQELRESIRSLNRILEEELQPGVQAVKDVARRIDTLTVEKRDDVVAIIDNLHSASAELDDIVKNNRERVETTLVKLDDIGTQVKDLLTQIQSPENTLNKMISSDSLYQMLNSVVANVDSLVSDVQRNPAKYLEPVEVRVDMFGGKK